MGITILLAIAASHRSVRTSIDKVNERINQFEVNLRERMARIEATMESTGESRQPQD